MFHPSNTLCDFAAIETHKDFQTEFFLFVPVCVKKIYICHEAGLTLDWFGS